MFCMKSLWGSPLMQRFSSFNFHMNGAPSETKNDLNNKALILLSGILRNAASAAGETRGAGLSKAFAIRGKA